MKKVALFFLVILLMVVYSNLSLINYGLLQARGQISILWQAEEVEDYLKKDIPDSTRNKLKFINEVRKYAVDSLYLNDSDNYTTIYDQKGRTLLWVVTACKPYSFEEKVWSFPMLGEMPYKGFFDEQRAVNELNAVKAEGYDASIRTPGGWSTLGWFRDPIMSNMLYRSYGDLANLIIHELVHATIFVKDSVEFNENLATFVADIGTLKFLEDNYGIQSEIYKVYISELNDEKKYINHILRGIVRLEQLYDSMDKSQSEQLKKKQKNDLIAEIMESTDTLSLNDKSILRTLKGFQPNNAYFMSFLRYRSKQDLLKSLYEDEFNKDIVSFIEFLKDEHPFL